MSRERYEAAVRQFASQAFYPPVIVITEGDYEWMVCANGHRWGSIHPREGCGTCMTLHKYRAAGRPECNHEGCNALVTCSDKAFEAGVRECERHWRIARGSEWNTGPVCIDELVTVWAEYSNLRWNGWLMPNMDAWSVNKVLELLKGDVPETYEWEWLDDGSLSLTEVLYRDEDPEYSPEILIPNEDGLYALGAGSWVWAEDSIHAATETGAPLCDTEDPNAVTDINPEVVTCQYCRDEM